MVSKFIGCVVQRPGWEGSFRYIIIGHRRWYYVCRIVYNYIAKPSLPQCMIIPAGIVFENESSVFAGSSLVLLTRSHLKYIVKKIPTELMPMIYQGSEVHSSHLKKDYETWD